MTDATPRLIDVGEVARLVRRSLKNGFPDVRFSVRSVRYAGGASILVKWKAGPREAAVRATVSRYAVSRMDGDYLIADAERTLR